jgi:Ca2+-binding RTX toxin-like protein
MTAKRSLPRPRPFRRLQITAGAGLLASLVLLAIALSSASGAAACSVSRSLSTDGTVLRGGSCSETIVVTSPDVRRVYGGEGDDTIYANPDVVAVYGGAGDDVMYGDLPETPSGRRVERRALARTSSSLATSSAEVVECAPKAAEGKPCYGGPGNQEMVGGAGDDVIFGQRGNDTLLGNSGNDALFGGIGDETVVKVSEKGVVTEEAGIRGGDGEDLLSGGYGKDKLNGEEGNDLVRGDGTTDVINDGGTKGTDTLSYATGVTPGFIAPKIPAGYENFPGEAENEERGVDVSIGGGEICEGINSAKGVIYQGCNNSARYGGGSDEVQKDAFENLIGSPFSDRLFGSEGINRIDGGGGADVIFGKGNNDTLLGGADGDYLDGEAGTDTVNGQAGTNFCAETGTPSNCTGGIATPKVSKRETGQISVGLMAETFPANMRWSEVYLVGSSGNDTVVADYAEGATPQVKFTSSSGTTFAGGAAESAGCEYTPTVVKCTLKKKPDTILMAGMAGDDNLSFSGFPQFIPITPILLGGEGNDKLFGTGATEDVLVDGNGTFNDVLTGRAFDDALVNNEGRDELAGGNGNDLFVSLRTCEGDLIEGGEEGKADPEADVNNASWAPMLQVNGGVTVDLGKNTAGDGYTTLPTCPAGKELDTIKFIDDVEGSNQADQLYGDGNPNSLFGHNGEDTLFARGGNHNFIEARDGGKDKVDGGEGANDLCKLDEGVDNKTGCDEFVK